MRNIHGMNKLIFYSVRAPLPIESLSREKFDRVLFKRFLVGQRRIFYYFFFFGVN